MTTLCCRRESCRAAAGKAAVADSSGQHVTQGRSRDRSGGPSCRCEPAALGGGGRLLPAWPELIGPARRPHSPNGRDCPQFIRRVWVPPQSRGRPGGHLEFSAPSAGFPALGVARPTGPHMRGLIGPSEGAEPTGCFHSVALCFPLFQLGLAPGRRRRMPEMPGREPRLPPDDEPARHVPAPPGRGLSRCRCCPLPWRVGQRGSALVPRGPCAGERAYGCTPRSSIQSRSCARPDR